MVSSLRVFLMLALVASSHAGGKSPADDDIQFCCRSDPNFDDCVASTLEALRYRLKRPVSSLCMEGYDPLNIAEATVDYKDDFIEFDAVMENIKVTGMSNFVLNSFTTSSPDHLSWQISFSVPELQVEDDFQVAGNLLSTVPIDGKGSLTGTLENVQITMAGTCELIECKCKQYLQVSSMTSDVLIGNAKVSFSGPELIPATSDFIGANIGPVLNAIKPVVQEAVNELFKTALNEIFIKVPYDTLVPPCEISCLKS